MSVRACVYKDCENYTINNIPNKNFTIFQFPKDPERRKQWFELGKVNPFIPANEAYMCSDHFDRKYMSIAARRTILVGAAVPFPYEKDTTESIDYQDEVDEAESEYVLVDYEKKITQGEEEEEDILKTCKNEVFDHDNHHMNEEDDPIVEHESDNSYENELIYKANADHQQQTTSAAKVRDYVVVKSLTKTTELRRKRINSSNNGPSPKIKLNTPKGHQYYENCKSNKKVLPSESKSDAFPKATANESTGNASAEAEITMPNAMDESNLVDKNHVTTFIFKGEEFVQMSKAHYVSEKVNLLKTLEKYERVFKKIQSSMIELN